MKKPHDTSWGNVAEWYSEYLETSQDSYQRQVILPNLLRILGDSKGARILDLACGQGFFSREFAQAGMTVVGADISKDLIAQAKKLPGDIEYHVAPANKLDFAKDASFDAAVVVLAIQNIEDMAGTFAEAARVLVPGGRLVLVMMHPAFRNPQKSSWGWDDETKAQYRRTDAYLSLARTTLLVHPGKKDSPTTTSYHRSLQDFSKALFKAGFVITRLEEWISHKQSGKGPRQAAENAARKEIPLFLMLEARKD
jgi:ubiquinone/menaquinone biosynthesis C-methylase UbiE